MFHIPTHKSTTAAQVAIDRPIPMVRWVDALNPVTTLPGRILRIASTATLRRRLLSV